MFRRKAVEPADQWEAESSEGEREGKHDAQVFRPSTCMGGGDIYPDSSRGAWVAQSVKRPTSARSRSRGREFEPRVGLWADGSEPGACFRFRVSLSLCPSPVHALSLSVPKINKR